MKDKNSLFDQPTSPQHDEKVLLRVGKVLLQNRRNNLRRIVSWLLVPAFASLFGFYLIQNNKENENLAADDFLLDTVNQEDLELLADLELFEDIDTLEEWDGSEEA